jgi:hypothetical protein
MGRFAQEDEAKSILPVAHAGEYADYLQGIRLTWSGDRRIGHAPVIDHDLAYVAEGG